jgi:hypothetical protein
MQVYLVKDESLPFPFKHSLVLKAQIIEIPAQKRKNLKIFAVCGKLRKRAIN